MLHIQKISRSSLQSIVSIFFIILPLLSFFNSRLASKKPPSNEDLIKNIKKNIEEKIEKLLQQKYDQKNKTKSSAVEFEQYLQNLSSMNILKKRIITGSRINIFELFPLQNDVTKKMDKKNEQLTYDINLVYYLTITLILVSSIKMLFSGYKLYNNKKEMEKKCSTKNYNNWIHKNRDWINKNSNWIRWGHMPHNPSFSDNGNNNLNLFIRSNTYFSSEAIFFTCFVGLFAASLYIYFNDFAKAKEKANNQCLLIKTKWNEWWDDMINEIQNG